MHDRRFPGMRPLFPVVTLLATGCVVESIDAIIAERGVTDCPSSSSESSGSLDTSTGTSTGTSSDTSQHSSGNSNTSTSTSGKIGRAHV